jgi:hypothetical protein
MTSDRKDGASKGKGHPDLAPALNLFSLVFVSRLTHVLDRSSSITMIDENNMISCNSGIRGYKYSRTGSSSGMTKILILSFPMTIVSRHREHVEVLYTVPATGLALRWYHVACNGKLKGV